MFPYPRHHPEPFLTESLQQCNFVGMDYGALTSLAIAAVSILLGWYLMWTYVLGPNEYIRDFFDLGKRLLRLSLWIY